jgi:kumamolisin
MRFVRCSLVLTASFTLLVSLLSACADSKLSSPGAAGELIATSTQAATAAGRLSTAELVLNTSENACANNVAQEYFQVVNTTGAPVSLSDLSIKYWIYDTSGQQVSPHVWYAGCVTTANGTCIHPVTAASIAASNFAACGSDPSHQANWEITLSTTDTFAVPPGGAWTGVQTAVNLANYSPFSPGSSTWFSGCGAGQPFAVTPNFGLYYQGNLVFSQTQGISAPDCRAPHGTQQLSGYTSHSTGIHAPIVQHVPPTTPIHVSLTFPIQTPTNGDPDISTFIQTVSDPKSSSYRKYLTVDRFADDYGLDPTTFGNAGSFVTGNNLSIVESAANRLSVFAVGAASDIERTFYLTLNVYRRPDGSTFIETDREPSLDLATTVAHVSGLDDFGVARPRWSGGTANANGQSLLGAPDLHNAYAGCSTAKSLDGTGQTVAIVAFDGYTGCDISSHDPTCGSSTATGYVDQFGLKTAAGGQPSVNRILLDEVEGDIQNASGGQETSLDIDMVLAMAPGAQINVVESHWGARSVATFFTNIGEGTDYYQDHIMNRIATMSPLPAQVTSSWVQDRTEAVKNAIYEFAAQGQSFFYGTGDLPSDQFMDEVGTMSALTIVGGTELNLLSGQYQSETGWSGTAGGVAADIGGNQPLDLFFFIGYSEALPSYQDNVPGLTLTVGRNVPDVSMAADGLYTIYGQSPGGSFGSSAATPLWAGFTALINQEGAESGLLPVGFLNPVLYDFVRAGAPLYGEVFNDITSGQQSYPSSLALSPGFSGYSAGPNYDLVTGLGSPKCSMITQLGTIDPLAPPQKLRIVANVPVPSTDPSFPTSLADADGSGMLSSSNPPPAAGLGLGVEDFITRTTNGGLGGDTNSSAPVMDLTCDPGAAATATVYYSYCVYEDGSGFHWLTSTDPSQDTSMDQSAPVGGSTQFTMQVTCEHADVLGNMQVAATYQLWNGCGSGRIPTGRDPGSGDYSVESGGGCGVLGLGQCWNNLSLRTMRFVVNQGTGVIADPNVCFEVKTHFNNANGCDDNHVRTDTGLGSPPGGLAFLNYQ